MTDFTDFSSKDWLHDEEPQWLRLALIGATVMALAFLLLHLGA